MPRPRDVIVEYFETELPHLHAKEGIAVDIVESLFRAGYQIVRRSVEVDVELCRMVGRVQGVGFRECGRAKGHTGVHEYTRPTRVEVRR